MVCQHYAMVMQVKCHYLIYSYTITPLVVKKSWERKSKRKLKKEEVDSLTTTD